MTKRTACSIMDLGPIDRIHLRLPVVADFDNSQVLPGGIAPFVVLQVDQKFFDAMTDSDDAYRRMDRSETEKL